MGKEPSEDRVITRLALPQRRALALLSCLVLLGAGPASPAAALGKADKGTTGAAFLKLSAGARQAAMGDAFSGVADDVYALYFNPAGLAFLKGVEAGAMHNSHFQDISHSYGVLAVPLLSWVETRRQRNALGTAAFSLTSLSVRDIQRRGLIETDAPTGTFEAQDLAYTLGYGFPLSGRLGVGGALKIVDQDIDSLGSRTLSTDAGLLYRGPRFSAGAGYRNLGGKVAFRSQEDPLPLLLYMGGGMRLRPRWLFSAEVRMPSDAGLLLSAGTEYTRAFGELRGAVRAGFDTGKTDAEGFSGVSLGAGVRYRKMDFDFAWVPFGDLGNTFRYSIRVKF